MPTLFKTIVACSAIAVSGIALAQTGAAGTSGTGADAQSGSKDPYVQNREEKAQSRKDYRKDKSISKQQYSQERKEANKRLRQSGAQTDTTKNTEVPSTR